MHHVLPDNPLITKPSAPTIWNFFTMNLSYFLVSAVTLISFHTNFVAADCCNPGSDCIYYPPFVFCNRCEDGTGPTPCCGYGSWSVVS